MSLKSIDRSINSIEEKIHRLNRRRLIFVDGSDTGEVIHRLRRKLTESQLVTISDGLILSKVRYALPLFTKVRVEETDPIHSKLNQVQVKINNLVRMILHKKLSDKISRKEMHEKFLGHH